MGPFRQWLHDVLFPTCATLDERQQFIRYNIEKSEHPLETVIAGSRVIASDGSHWDLIEPFYGPPFPEKREWVAHFWAGPVPPGYAAVGRVTKYHSRFRVIPEDSIERLYEWKPHQRKGIQEFG